MVTNWKDIAIHSAQAAGHQKRIGGLNASKERYAVRVLICKLRTLSVLLDVVRKE